MTAAGAYQPMPATPAVSPRDVRGARLTAKLDCPRCGRLVFEAIPLPAPFAYHLFVSCDRKQCNADLWVIVLPGGSTAHALLTLFSPAVAIALFRRVSPAFRDVPLEEIDSDSVWGVPLVAPGAQAFIVCQVPGHVKRRSLADRAPGDQIARALELHR